MIRLTVLALAAIGALAVPAAAQGDTLAGMRAELAQLAAEMQSLRGELVSGGAPALQSAGGASALERMDAMEAALSRLTAQSEALQNRIDRVVSDGTNRIGDLEFRLCELEPGCDVGNMPITATLGGGNGGGVAGGIAPVPAPAAPAAPSSSAAMAVNEQADFDRAKEALDSGSFRSAADLFAAYAQTYPGGPLTGEAHFLRGEALGQLGETAQAARAYLEAFSGQPDGPRAADSLLRLGTTLGQLGQTQEACVTLAEVGTRFPNASAALEANSAMRNIGCL